MNLFIIEYKAMAMGGGGYILSDILFTRFNLLTSKSIGSVLAIRGNDVLDIAGNKRDKTQTESRKI